MTKKVKPIPKPQRRRHFVKEWRKFRHLTQEQLAERVNVTPGAISQLELGRIGYSQPMLEALSEALGCRPGHLLDVDPTREGAIWSIWEDLDIPARNQLIEIAKTFGRTGTDD